MHGRSEEVRHCAAKEKVAVSDNLQDDISDENSEVNSLERPKEKLEVKEKIELKSEIKCKYAQKTILNDKKIKVTIKNQKNHNKHKQIIIRNLSGPYFCFPVNIQLYSSSGKRYTCIFNPSDWYICCIHIILDYSFNSIENPIYQ